MFYALSTTKKGRIIENRFFFAQHCSEFTESKNFTSEKIEFFARNLKIILRNLIEVEEVDGDFEFWKVFGEGFGKGFGIDGGG